MNSPASPNTGFGLLMTFALLLGLCPLAANADVHPFHPERRQVASPAKGVTVSQNPPPLLWPAASGSEVRYAIQLSQDSSFPKAATIQQSDIAWAFYMPHEHLSKGSWYWRYGATTRSQTEWSPIYEFQVTDAARDAVVPPASVMIGSIPDRHPRILVSSEDVSRLRQRAKDTDRLAAVVRLAERLLERPVAGVEAALPSKQGESEFEAKNFAKWASKAYAARLLEEINQLTVAYLLTGDTRYGEAAVERGLAVARLDPAGPTSRRVSDFADGSCMEAMAKVYDSCYECLDAKERTVMREAMVARVAPWFDRQVNSLESRVFNAHIWQHILLQATDVAIALLGEEAKAEQWLTYVYEMWQARVPLLGGDDGGWANGINYFGTNFKTLLEMPTLFERYTDKADFFAHPWYRNTIYYQLYGWPPGSVSDGFGDGAERYGLPSMSRAMFLYFLGTRLQEPAGIWYAKKVAGDRDLNSLLTPMLWADRLVQRDPQQVPPAILPQLSDARAFRDVGIVSMHANLPSAVSDLMISFRSSPYGSYNHMHSDQNSINIALGGKRVFSGSGYYIGYGDDHFKGWYTHTRGHNTVLIDGKGQVRGADGFGWIARYLHGQQISYCTGDASSAYGDAGLTRFRRHVAFLRPSTIVIYDDLAADHAANWSWLLHSPHQIDWDKATHRLMVEASESRAQANLFGSSKLSVSITDQFDPPAVNWREKTSGGEVIQYPDQWHVTAEPADEARTMRYLAVIQLSRRNSSEPIEGPVMDTEGVLRVPGWKIDAELDAAKPASLLIRRNDEQAVLAVDFEDLSSNGVNYKTSASESLLIESGTVQRCEDERPH